VTVYCASKNRFRINFKRSAYDVTWRTYFKTLILFVAQNKFWGSDCFPSTSSSVNAYAKPVYKIRGFNCRDGTDANVWLTKRQRNTICCKRSEAEVIKI